MQTLPIEYIKTNHPFCYELMNDGTNIQLIMGGGMAFTDNTVGYIPSKETLYIAEGLPSIDHEIAHMLEMRDFNRLTKVDLGLESPFDRNAKFTIKESAFFAASAREARVVAIQSVINAIESIHSIDHRLDTYTRNISISVRALGGRKLTNNIIWENKCIDFLKNNQYGRFKTSYDYVQWIDDIHEKTVKAWTKDRIIVEFKNRLNFINNWMETK